MARQRSDRLSDEITPAEPAERWPIPAEWRWARVSDLGNVKLGRQLATSKRQDATSTPYLRAANIISTGLDLTKVLRMEMTDRERESLSLARGDVVLAEASGSPSQVGRSALWSDEVPCCCFQNTVIRFRPHGLLPDFALVTFQYFLAAGVFSRASRGVGIQHLGASRFAQLELPVPGMAEQARIVAETKRRVDLIGSAGSSLESALLGIEGQVSAVLEAAATGQLGVAIGADAGRTTGHCPPNATDALARVVIPGSWSWAIAREVGDIHVGKKREPKHEQGEHVVPYLRVANVLEDRIEVADLLSMNFTPSEQEFYQVREGDILLNEGQSPELVGRPAIYRGEFSSVCFQNTLLRFRPGNLVNPEFALLVFRHYYRSGIFRSISKWSTNIAHLSLERFIELPFPVPGLDEQDKLASLARSRLDQLEEQRASVLASRAGVDEMKREIYAAAVRGDLSTRDPDDESAEDMLVRLGPPAKESKSAGRLSPIRNAADADEDDHPGEHQDLASVLGKNGGRMAAEDLFAAAGYDRDLTREVERFYLSLREAAGRSIRSVGSEGSRTILEVLPP